MRIKLIAILILTASTLTFCTNEPGKTDESSQHEVPGSQIVFTSNLHDFGTIPYDSDGRCYFEFKNESDIDLVINNVRTTCGCTRPEWPEEPVAPGETGKIGITYNTKIPGQFSKAITVYCNAENSPVKLFVRGKVEPEKLN